MTATTGASGATPPPGPSADPSAGHAEHSGLLSAPTKKDIKPSVAWYWVGAALLVLGIGAGFTLLVVGIVGVASAPDGYQRVSVPGERTLQLPSAGTYELFGERTTYTSSSSMRAPQVVVTDAAGTQVPVAKRSISSTSSYTYQGYRGYKFGTISVGAPGRYTFTVSDPLVTDDPSPLPPTTPTTSGSRSTTSRTPTTTYTYPSLVPVRIAVGEDVGGRTAALILSGLGLMSVAAIAGIILLIVVAVKRSGSRKRLFPPVRPAFAGYPPGPYGPYGAPGYGAPGYGVPGYGAPGYGGPGWGGPGYGGPGYGAPGYGGPGPGAPGRGAPYGPYGAPGAAGPGYGGPPPGAPRPGYGGPPPGAAGPAYGGPPPGAAGPAYGGPPPAAADPAGGGRSPGGRPFGDGEPGDPAGSGGEGQAPGPAGPFIAPGANAPARPQAAPGPQGVTQGRGAPDAATPGPGGWVTRPSGPPSGPPVLPPLPGAGGAGPSAGPSAGPRDGDGPRDGGDQGGSGGWVEPGGASAPAATEPIPPRPEADGPPPPSER